MPSISDFAASGIITLLLVCLTKTFSFVVQEYELNRGANQIPGVLHGEGHIRFKTKSGPDGVVN